MGNLQLPPFRLIHAAYVTGDLEKGARRLTTMFGIDEFKIYPELSVGVPGGEAKITFALASANGIDLEVIQPLGGKDDVYRRALPDDPADIRFHHFASRIDGEEEWQKVMDAVHKHRVEVLVEGGENHGSKYIYLDTRAHLGHLIEYIWPYQARTKTVQG